MLVRSIDFEESQGQVMTRQGNSFYGDKFEHIEGRLEETSVVRNVGERFTASTLTDTDLADRPVRNNPVSLTPLHLDPQRALPGNSLDLGGRPLTQQHKT